MSDRVGEIDGQRKSTNCSTLCTSVYKTQVFLLYTVEPPNKGHFGANSFVPCREVVPISEVYTLKY